MTNYNQCARDLLAARALLKTKDTWSERSFYAEGKVCAVAALEVAMANRGVKLAFFTDILKERSYQYLLQSSLQLFRADPMAVNDLLGYESVMQMYNRACDQARRRAKIDLAEAEKNRTLYSLIKPQNTSNSSGKTP